MYVSKANGAFVRSKAKWIEKGERNTAYFFALEKRNFKRNSLSALYINNNLCTDPKLISDFVSFFSEKPYQSNFNYDLCKSFTYAIQDCIPLISNDFKNLCDSDLKKEELLSALQYMKKGKSPGPDGLSTEFYQHFWEVLKDPLFLLFNECI